MTYIKAFFHTLYIQFLCFIGKDIGDVDKQREFYILWSVYILKPMKLCNLKFNYIGKKGAVCIVCKNKEGVVRLEKVEVVYK